jgi:hypothetical protein
MMCKDPFDLDYAKLIQAIDDNSKSLYCFAL